MTPRQPLLLVGLGLKRDSQKCPDLAGDQETHSSGLMGDAEPTGGWGHVGHLGLFLISPRELMVLPSLLTLLY